MNKKKLIKIANEVIALEEEMERGGHIAYNESKIEEIYGKLSVEDLFFVQEYIDKYFDNK